MRSLSWRCIGAVAVLLTFTASKPLAGAGPGAEAAGQEKATDGAKVDAEKIIEDWIFPGATKEQTWSNLYPSPKHLNPYVARRSTAKPYREVWDFYAKKCGSDANYEKNEAGGGHNDTGSYTYFTRPQSPDGAEQACFIRVAKGHAVTALITKKKGGADIEIICIAR
jgi:hypothetical protein